MREDSFSKFCISACIFMILISLSINVVAALDIFNMEIPSTLIDQTTQDQTTVGGFDITSLFGANMTSLLVPVGALAVIVLAVAAAGRTGSWVIVGVALFGIVFWGSWIFNISTISSYGDFMATPVMTSIMLMITVVMTFIFSGAVIGMLGGND